MRVLIDANIMTPHDRSAELKLLDSYPQPLKKFMPEAKFHEFVKAANEDLGKAKREEWLTKLDSYCKEAEKSFPKTHWQARQRAFFYWIEVELPEVREVLISDSLCC